LHIGGQQQGRQGRVIEPIVHRVSLGRRHGYAWARRPQSSCEVLS
jgi:hypothetical protein